MIESLFDNLAYIWSTMDFKAKLGIIVFIIICVIAKGKSSGNNNKRSGGTGNSDSAV